MSSLKLTIVICLSLISSVLAAPTDPTTTAAPASETPATTTTVTPAGDLKDSAPATDGTEAKNTTSSMAVSSIGDIKDINTTSSMAVSSIGDIKDINTNTFTCYGRVIGYYADIEHKCKVYHFCMPGEYGQDIVYQRISYLCLNETVFDQQALDCVEEAKLSAPCKDSEKFYQISNNVLRQALIGTVSHDSNSSATPAANAATPAETSSTTTSTTAAPTTAPSS